MEPPPIINPPRKKDRWTPILIGTSMGIAVLLAVGLFFILRVYFGMVRQVEDLSTGGLLNEETKRKEAPSTGPKR